MAQTPAPPGPGPQIVVRDIAVQGNRRVQEAVILGRVQTKVGGPFAPARLAEDIRAIFTLGFFDDVQAKVEDFEGGVKITFVVVERPFLRDITFSGNKKLDAATLLQKIDLRLGSVYNPAEVRRAAEALKDHYEEEGYYEVQITPEVERLPDGDVSLVFRIAEGRRITIDKVVIEGNQGLTEKQIKAVLATQERQYFVLRGTVQRQRLEADAELITQLYNDHGFIQARVESPPEIKIDRENATAIVIFRVVEGPQFRVGGIDITGNTVLPVVEIQRRIRMKSGDVFSRGRLRDSVQAITDLYGSIGRASAEVNPQVTTDLANHLVNLTFEITEGPEVYVERINITGNTRSQEKILRREVPMHEGDLFTIQKLARARQRLINLGYFDDVRASTSPGSSKDRIIVNIEVRERPTGTFSLGGGYSSADGFIGTVDLSQRNFLGRGWEVGLRIRAGGETQQGTISFTEPWLFDRPLAAGFDLYSNRRVFDDYTADSLGLNLRVGHPLGDFARWNAYYRLSRDDISDLPADAGPELQDQEGTTITSLIGAGLVRDTRDNAFDPTRGTIMSIAADFAGIGWGGDDFNRFYRVVVNAGYFQPLPWFEHVLSFRVSGGYLHGWGGQSSPIFERFFLGGPNSVRSFKARTLAPEDEFGNVIGGNSFVLGTVEYTIPLFFGIKAAAFVDVGQAYGPDIPGGTPFSLSQLRYAGGGGLRWRSPFGPLRVDYGINLDRRAGESFGEFQFSVGSSF
ncbi:MAG: outer membrane protein assembly factor BamA [Candidatus Rokubacteria bacterium]|nr:outer membrane protein assembly factor BamA [Candidatus Rokubacteria bacterium]